MLVVRADNLGDVLMAGPALRALGRAAPRAELTLLAAPAGAAAAPLLPAVDAVLPVSPSWQQLGGDPVDPAADAELVSRLAAGRFDAAVVLTSFSQSPWPAAYACLLAGIPVRVGMSKEFGGAGLTHWVPAVDDAVHQVDRMLALLAAVGVPAAGRRMTVAVPPAAAAAARAALASVGVPAGVPYAVLLPGASCPSRRWPASGFAAVATGLAAAGLVPVVTGTARERTLVETVLAGAGAGAAAGLAAGTGTRATAGTAAGTRAAAGTGTGARTGTGTGTGLAARAGLGTGAGVGSAARALVGALDVPQLAALLAGAGVAVVNNSGGLHLAAAVGTPAVCAFAGTELESQYAPRDSPAVLLRRPTACAPCRQLRCPYGHECLDLDPAEVVAAALSLADIHRQTG